jgi:hypothetical protein
LKVELIQTGGFDSDLLADQVNAFIQRSLPLGSTTLTNTQFCITSLRGDDDFLVGSGNTTEPPESFCKLNPTFKNTVISDLVHKFPEYTRWRILCLKPKQTYSIHHDSSKPGFQNIRIHIPVVSNPESFLCFYEHKLQGNGAQRMEHHNLNVGEIYKVNTTGYHTAVNYNHTQMRIHIVAERFIPNE